VAEVLRCHSTSTPGLPSVRPGHITALTDNDFKIAMTTKFSRERQIAIEAVRSASTICRSVQSSISPDALEKKDRSPVTIADFASQAVICHALEQSFPDDPVIGEEDSRELQREENAPFLEKILDELNTDYPAVTPQEVFDWIDRGNAEHYADRFWTLDPIDGTKGFLRGEQYAISLALIVQGQIQLALLGCPNLSLPSGQYGGIFVAIRGEGSRMIPLDGEPSETNIEVSGTTESTKARFCESVESGHSSHSRSAQVATCLGITQESIRLDSQAKYAIVARGEADIYLRLPTRADYNEKIWDHAGGVLVVEEAGGTVTDLFGKPLEWTHGSELISNKGIVATNGILHADVLQALAEVFAS